MSSPPSKWQRFWRLPAAERSVLIRSLFLVPVTAMALRTIGFRRWTSFLSKFAPQKNAGAATPSDVLDSARGIARMVAAAAKEGIVHGKCLEQSIALWWLLLRRRVPAELRIGVRQSGTGLEAHAWVEIQGNIVNDSEDVLNEYVPFREDIGALGVKPH